MVTDEAVAGQACNETCRDLRGYRIVMVDGNGKEKGERGRQ